MTPSYRRHPSGMTLIELVAALALASLGMIGSMSVLRAVSRPAIAEQATDIASEQPIPLADDLLAALRPDLQHAAWIAYEENELTLLGYSAFDADSSRIEYRPVRIEYRVEELGDTPWIIRIQRRLDVTTNEPDTVRLVGPAPHGFYVIPMLTQAAMSEPASVNPGRDGLGGGVAGGVGVGGDALMGFARREAMHEMPERVRVTLVLDAEGEKFDRRVLIIR